MSDIKALVKEIAEDIRTGSARFAPAYDPPYDSPIEHDFAWQVVKFMHEKARIEKQVWVETKIGRFRLDFVLTRTDGSKVVVECDGKNFHDKDRDQLRDLAVLATGQFDAIYRLRGTDIFDIDRLNDALALIASHEPSIFDDHGRHALTNLCRKSLHGHFGFSESSFEYEYPHPSDEDEDDENRERRAETLHLIRRTKKWRGGWL